MLICWLAWLGSEKWGWSRRTSLAAYCHLLTPWAVEGSGDCAFHSDTPSEWGAKHFSSFGLLAAANGPIIPPRNLFFPPAGSQREREVVAPLSKHAAVRCYAKTPKNVLITSQFKKYWRLTPHPPPPLSPAAVWQIWLWNVAQLTCNILSQAFFNPSQNFSDLICCQSRQTVCRLQTIAAHMDWAVLCQLHFAFHSTGASNKARIKSDWSTAEESINRDLSTPCSTLFTGCLQNENVPWI